MERVTVEMINVVDGASFHVRIIDKNSSYGKLDLAMNHFDVKTSEEL